MYGLLHGLEPHRLDDNILRFTGGSVASFNAPWDVMNFPSPHNDVSLLRQGLWGVDQDPATLPTFADLFPYVIKHPETGEAGIILSQVNFTAAMPPGFEMQRKLPFGVVLSGQKKLRPYHLSGWPGKAIVRYTTVESGGSAEWQAMPIPGSSGEAKTWTEIDFKNWVPDNARCVTLLCEVSSTGQAGYAMMRAVANGGIRVGSCNPVSGVASVGEFTFGLRSNRALDYMTVGAGVKLTLRVLEYRMTEPTA
jgi:hypothetical protein